MLGHGDLLPALVTTGIEGRGEDQPRGHVTQQRGLQHLRVREKLLAIMSNFLDLPEELEGGRNWLWHKTEVVD